jgi:hypothetical protein
MIKKKVYLTNVAVDGAMVGFLASNTLRMVEAEAEVALESGDETHS